jgi:hypothetical protein
MSSTSSASGLLKRNIRVATGVRAITAPASRPPRWASRSSMLHGFNPKRRTERPVIHRAAGGLSTVIA